MSEKSEPNSTLESTDNAVTESVAAVPVKTKRSERRNLRKHNRQINKEDRQKSNQADKTPEDKRQKRHFKYVVIGGLVVAVAAGGAVSGYVYGHDKPNDVPGTADEGLLIKQQIQEQAANKCLDAAAGRIVLHKGAVVYETPEILAGGSHANVLSDFVPSKKKAQDIPYPVRVIRNGTPFYEFSTSSTAVEGDLGAPDIAKGKVYVSQSDAAVEWQPDTSVTAHSLCAELDPAGNLVLTHGNTLIAYSQPLDESALPATQKLDATSQDVLASLRGAR
jgi:hypothetical protein